MSNALFYLSQPELLGKIPDGYKRRPLDPNALRVAIEASISTFHRYKTPNGFLVPLMDRELRKLDSHFVLWREEDGSGGRAKPAGLRVEDLPLSYWLQVWAASERQASLLWDYALIAARYGGDIPPGFRQFMTKMIGRNQLKPPKHGRASHTLHRDYLLSAVAHWVSERWMTGFGMSNKDYGMTGSTTPCGVTVAAAALYSFGQSVAPRSAANRASEHRKQCVEALSCGKIHVGMINPLASLSGDVAPLEDLESRVEKAFSYFGDLTYKGAEQIEDDE